MKKQSHLGGTGDSPRSPALPEWLRSAPLPDIAQTGAGFDHCRNMGHSTGMPAAPGYTWPREPRGNTQLSDLALQESAAGSYDWKIAWLRVKRQTRKLGSGGKSMVLKAGEYFFNKALGFAFDPKVRVAARLTRGGRLYYFPRHARRYDDAFDYCPWFRAYPWRRGS